MTLDLRRLPTIELAKGTQLYRIHRVGNGAWYFDNSSDGRFNPVGSGLGASYWAEAPLGAFVEVFRTRMRLTEADIRLRCLTEATLKAPVKTADLTARAALAAGFATEVTHGADYGPAQQIAGQLVRLVGGVRWRLRHDLAQELVGVALFGNAGDRPRYAREQSSEISLDLQDLAAQEFGYEVLPAVTR